MSDCQQQTQTASDEDENETPWIEADFQKVEEDEGSPDISDLFADPDPYETFEFHFDPDIGITLTGFKEENGQTLNSTGLTIWRASHLLCDYLVANPEFVKGKKVLELGAGLGLCGILSYHLQANKITLTDGDTDTLANMRINVNRNCKAANTKDTTKTISCKQFVWGCDISGLLERNGGTFETILGADIIYVEEVVEPLFRSVSQLLSHDGQFVLAYARRNVKIDIVFEQAKNHGFVWTTPEEVEGVFVFTREELETDDTR